MLKTNVIKHTYHLIIKKDGEYKMITIEAESPESAVNQIPAGWWFVDYHDYMNGKDADEEDADEG